MRRGTATYAEIGVTTNFSFLHGASHPQEYVHQASQLGLAAIGIADRNTLAGVVRAYGELDNPGKRATVICACRTFWRWPKGCCWCWCRRFGSRLKISSRLSSRCGARPLPVCGWR